MNEFNEYVRDSFTESGDIAIKPMMGGYLVYFNGKLIGDICNNELFLKKTPTSDKLLADLYPDAVPIALADPERSVSKTHAALAPTLDGVWVTDLHSTNGTRIEQRNRTVAATPDVPAPALGGAVIRFGRTAYRVEV